MPRLNEVIAVVAGKKSRVNSTLTGLYHKLQKISLFTGLTRNYRPKDEEGDKLPAESQRVQVTATECIQEGFGALHDLFDLVATQDHGNCEARADINVDGTVVMENVPVTHLLFLEKQLVDVRTFLTRLPTLDPAFDWEYSEEAACYKTPVTETTKTKKVRRNHIKAPATEQHPAQVETYAEDVIIGYWNKIDFSGAIPEQTRKEYIERVEALQDAVKRAREDANSKEVPWKKGSIRLFSFILTGNPLS